MTELIGCFANGVCNWKLKNIDWNVFKNLLIPSMLGALLGAFIFVNFPAEYIEPLAALYSIAMDAIILIRILKPSGRVWLSAKEIFPIGVIGGFFDAMGARGWGLFGHAVPRGDWIQTKRQHRRDQYG